MNLPFDFVLLRAPIQSLEKAFCFSEKPGTLFEEALYLSSPEYWRELMKVAGDSPKDVEKIERTFHKYWVRSCSRCTPFATFAGTKLVKLTEHKTNLLLEENNEHTRSIRLDMNYLSSIVLKLAAQAEIREQLTYITNKSIYKIAGQYRYVEYKIKDGIRIYELSSVLVSPHLEALLDRAKYGAGYPNLVSFLAEMEQVPCDTAAAFIEELINCQLLTPDIEPAITGNDPLDSLICRLEELSGTQILTAHLKQIRETLITPERGVTYYQRLEKQLEAVSLTPDTDRFTLQADLFLSFKDCSVEKGIIAEIVQQTNALLPLTYKYEKRELAEFKNRFYEKYQDQEICLSIAMDPDLGIGYGSVMYEHTATDGFAEDIKIQPAPEASQAFSDPLLSFKLRKYLECQNTGSSFIALEDKDLHQITRKDQEIVQPAERLPAW